MPEIAELLIEIAVIGAPSKLSVGGDPQAHALLQRHDVGNGASFGRGQHLATGFAALDAPAQIQEALRAQQASDMISTKWRRQFSLLGEGRIPWVRPAKKARSPTRSAAV